MRLSRTCLIFLTQGWLDSWSWGSVFLDAENDGDLDLYISCMFNGSFAGYASSAFYENQSNGSFTEPSNIGFLDDTGSSHGSAIGDLNNDGKLDIAVMNNENQLPHIWNNQSSSVNNYLAIKLEGVTSNRDGVGSIIEISVNNQKQYRYVMSGEGYISQNSFKELFGLGSAIIVDYVKVKWLSGVEDIIYNVNANQIISITENATLYTEHFQFNDVIQVYPNPTSNEIKIRSKDEELKRIILFNVRGQKVKEQLLSAKSHRLSLNSLPKGIYFLTLHTSKYSLKGRKIIKE